MTDPQPPAPSPPPQWEGRHPAVAALMIIAGVLLLLPGLCSGAFLVFFLYADWKLVLTRGEYWPLWFVCFAVSFGGILLLRSAVRGRRPPR